MIKPFSMQAFHIDIIHHRYIIKQHIKLSVLREIDKLKKNIISSVYLHNLPQICPVRIDLLPYTIYCHYKIT